MSTQHSFFTVTELVFSITKKKKNLEMVLNEVDGLVKDDQTDGVWLEGLKWNLAMF